MDVIRHRSTYLAIAALIVGASLVSVAAFGFKLGIDFEGGTVWQFSTQGGVADEQRVVEFFAEELGTTGAGVGYNENEGAFVARLPVVEEDDHQELLIALRDEFPGFEELGFQSLGPSVGNELRKKAIIGIVLVLLGISLYVAFAFRKSSKPVASWKYGVVTLVTLLHDVAVPAGLLALLGHVAGIEIDSNFVVALLVVMGFSVHDTIVVFDRIRENLARDRGASDFSLLINRSVRETIARSVNTSVTLIMVLLVLYFAGPAALSYFVLTLLVGVAVGTYSSIFVASALLFVVSGKVVRDSTGR